MSFLELVFPVKLYRFSECKGIDKRFIYAFTGKLFESLFVVAELGRVPFGKEGALLFSVSAYISRYAVCFVVEKIKPSVSVSEIAVDYTLNEDMIVLKLLL